MSKGNITMQGVQEFNIHTSYPTDTFLRPENRSDGNMERTHKSNLSRKVVTRNRPSFMEVPLAQSCG